MAFLLFAPNAHGETLAPTVHSDPAAGDNLRVYAFVDAPYLTFAVDGGAPSHLDGMSVVFTQLKPGRHEAAVTLPDGSHTSLNFALSTDALIESRGHHWWCLMAGLRDGQLTLLQPTTARCKAVTDSGPN